VRVTNQQLYLAIGIPMMFNAGLIGLLLAYINARFTAAESSTNQRFTWKSADGAPAVNHSITRSTFLRNLNDMPFEPAASYAPVRPR
jgi:hypothetical protein